MRTPEAISHLDTISRFSREAQIDVLKLMELYPSELPANEYFDAFCRKAAAMKKSALCLALSVLFGDDDAPYVAKMIDRYALRVKQPAMAGWWVARLVDFDSKVIPRSFHATQEAAVEAMSKDRELLESMGLHDEKLLVLFVPEFI